MASGNPILAQIIGEKGFAALLREVASAMELPVDEIVPTAEQLDERQQAAMEAQQRQLEQQLALQQDQAEQQVQLEAAKGEAKAVTDDRARTLEIIGEIVKQAVANAMVQSKPRRSKFDEGANGLIESAVAE